MHCLAAAVFFNAEHFGVVLRQLLKLRRLR